MTSFQIIMFNYFLEENRYITSDELLDRFSQRTPSDVLSDATFLEETEMIDTKGGSWIISAKGIEFSRKYNDVKTRKEETGNLELIRLRNEVLGYENKLKQEETKRNIAIAIAIIEAIGLLVAILKH